MGKINYTLSDYFCEYVLKYLFDAVESGIEFYQPKKILKRKCNLNEHEYGIKLLKCSNAIINEKTFYNLENSLVGYNNANYYCQTNDEFSNSPFAVDGIEVARKDINNDGKREVFSLSFQTFVYKKLTERLDSEIRESHKKIKINNVNHTNEGILLLNSSCCSITDSERPDILHKKKRKYFKFQTPSCVFSVNRKTRLLEAAVSPDWVLNRSGTIGWCDTKRPRIVNLRLKNTLSDGAIECTDISHL